MVETSESQRDRLDPAEPVAVLFVGGENELGPALVYLFESTWSREFRQVLFVSVGVMDYAVVDSGVNPDLGFKGSEEAVRLRDKTRRALDPYLEAARRRGLKVGALVSIATQPVEEIGRLAQELSATYPLARYFVGKLVFFRKRWFHRLLHGGAGEGIRKCLEQKGLPVTVLPVVLQR